MQQETNASTPDLLTIPKSDLEKMTASDLADLQSRLLLSMENDKERKKVLDAYLKSKYDADIQSALKNAKKDTGKVHITDGNVGIEVDVPKKVEWDQAGLTDVLNGMKPEDAKHYAKVSIAVDERKYASAPPDIKSKLLACRTVKPGNPKIIFEQLA